MYLRIKLFMTLNVYEIDVKQFVKNLCFLFFSCIEKKKKSFRFTDQSASAIFVKKNTFIYYIETIFGSIYFWL